jgi:ribosomal protein L31E
MLLYTIVVVAIFVIYIIPWLEKCSKEQTDQLVDNWANTDTKLDKVSEKVPEKISEKVPEKISEKISEKVPEKISEKVPEKVSEKVSEKVAEKVPEKVSEKVSEKVEANLNEMVYDDNNYDLLKVDQLKCSSDCCKFNQWPLPYDLNTPESNYIGTNFFCNNGNSSGCVCLTSTDMDVLSNHAGNLINNSCNK